MKIMPVISGVCACVRTSAEDDNFPTEGVGRVYLVILFNLSFYGLSEKIIFQAGNFGFARY